MNCYVCASSEKITGFQYPDGPKPVCPDCKKVLTDGMFIYKEKHPDFDHPVLHDKNVLHEIRKKAFEKDLTEAASKLGKQRNE